MRQAAAALLQCYPPAPSPSTSSSPCSSEEGGFAPHSTHNHQQQHTASTQQPPTATVDFGCLSTTSTVGFGFTVNPNISDSTLNFSPKSSTVNFGASKNPLTVNFGSTVVNQLNSTVVNLAGLRQEGFAPGLGAANTNSSSTNSSNSISSGTNHIQLMSQMVHGLTPEGVKLEAGSSSSTADAKPFAQDTSSLDYQSAAAAAVFQQHNFVYYNNPFCGTSAPAWPYGVAGTPHWSTFNANNKKGRQTYQREQTLVLERKFQECSYVSKKQRDELRSMTRLSDRQIKIWFQNRRMKAKKEKIRCSDEVDNQTTLIPANPPNKSTLNSNGSASPSNNNNLVPMSLNNNCSTSGSGVVMDDHSSAHLGDFIGVMESQQMSHMMGNGATTSSTPMIDPLAAWSQHTQHTHQLLGQHFANPYSYYYPPANGGLN